MKQVIYNGGIESFFSCSDPSILTTGQVYTVLTEDGNSWHTEYTLLGIDGKFNSMWFNYLKPTFFAIGNSIPIKGKSYCCNKVVITDSDCHMIEWHINNVQDITIIGENTYKIDAGNSVFLVSIR